MKNLFNKKVRSIVKNRVAPIIINCILLSTISQTLIGSINQDSISTQRVSYKTLSTFFPAPLLPTTPEKESNPDLSKPSEKTKHIKNIVEAGIAQVSDAERRKILFDLYTCKEESSLEKESSLTLIKDLELFVNENNTDGSSILSTLDRTKTTFGKVYLSSLLANPTNSLDELKKRQQLIRELVENDELFNQVDILLSKIKNAENGLFSLWRSEDETTKGYLQKNFYVSSKVLSPLNSNAPFMDINTRKGNLSTLTASSQPFLSYTLQTYLLNKALIFISKQLSQDKNALESMPTISLKNSFNETFNLIKKGLNPYNYIELYQNISQQVANNLIEEEEMSYKPYQTQDEDFLNNTRSLSKKVALVSTSLLAAAALGVGAYWLWNVKQASSDAALKQKALNNLHQRLIDSATIVTSCKELDSISKSNIAITEALKTKENLSQLFQPSDNKDFDALISHLQTKTFKGSPSFFSYSGRVLASHTLIGKHKDLLASAFKAIGEIDAYISIAKLYKESHKTKTLYSFAQFEKKEQPLIDLKGFWHPLVTAENVIKNDLSLGQSGEHRNIILTGSNTGGKSTLLKGALISLLLAQTCTIVPADELSFTPFALLGSYLHISDDISEGKSLFKAEVLRAKNLIEETGNLALNNFAFVVIDELFTGTAADKGAAAAKKIAEILMQKENVLSVLATHFPLLTDLEETSNGYCKNFKIDVIKNEDGTIIRPFKIEPGISITNIANDLLNEEMTDIDFSLD